MANEFNIEFEFRGQRYQDAQRGLEAFGKSIEKGLEEAANALAKELKSYLEAVALALAKRHGNPWPSGTTGKSLSKRSGRGIQSILSSVSVTGDTLNTIEGKIGGVGYLVIQETGGTIRAKKAKYLTIPLPAALNANGTPKKKSAREWDNTFVGQSKKGNLLIFQKSGSGIIPLYVLKKEVKIPPRLGMKETLVAGLPYFIDKAFDAMLDKIVQS